MTHDPLPSAPAGNGHFARLRRFTERPLVRNILKVLTGHVAGNFLLLVVLVILGRLLGKETFGVYSVMQAALIMIATTTDFGLNTTIVKYYREAVLNERLEEAEALMRWTGLLRLAIVSIVALGCIALAGPICQRVIKAPETVGLFRWVCIGAIGQSLWYFTQSALQARERFTYYALVAVVNNVIRLAAVLTLVALDRLTLHSAVIVLVIVPFLSALISFAGWPRDFWRARLEPGLLRRRAVEILHFSKWIFLSTLVCSFMVRLDPMMLSSLSTHEQVGLYSMASIPATAVPLITVALSAVLLPKLSSSRRREDIIRTLRAARGIALPMAGGIALALTAAHLLWVPVVGEEYRQAIWVFDLLLIAFSTTVVVNPLSFFSFAFGRARWLTFMNLIQLCICVVSNRLLIPRLGALGAGITSLLIYLFALAFVLGTIPRLLRLAETEPEPAAAAPDRTSDETRAGVNPVDPR